MPKCHLLLLLATSALCLSQGVEADTSLSAQEITANLTLTRSASPWRLSGHVRVAKGAVLAIQGGTVVEFDPGASLDVLGGILAQGTLSSPIAFQGRNWRLTIRGDSDSDFRHTRFQGSGSMVEVLGSTSNFGNCHFDDMKTALRLAEHAGSTLRASEFSRNGTALQVSDESFVDINGVSFFNNHLGLATASSLISADRLVFHENDVHVQADVPIDLKRTVFHDADFMEARSRLSGKVVVNWSEAPPEFNLQARWLMERFRLLAGALNKGDAERASGLARDAGDVLGEAGREFRDLADALDLLRGEDRKPEQPLANQVAQMEKVAAGSAWVWMQHAVLPFKPGLQADPATALPEADSQLGTDLLGQYFDLANASNRAGRLNLSPTLRQSLVLGGYREGDSWHAGVIRLFDRESAEKACRLVGASKHSLALFGLYTRDDRSEPLDALAALLGKNRLRNVVLGRSDDPSHAARSSGAGLLVSVDSKVTTRKSLVSTYTKLYEVNLVITVTDPKRGEVLYSMAAAGSQLDFEESAGIRRAVENALEKISTTLVANLERQDEAWFARRSGE